MTSLSKTALWMTGSEETLGDKGESGKQGSRSGVISVIA